MLLLFSLGLTLIYGVGRIVNFAHGALFSTGALVGVWFTNLGLPFWLCLIAAPVFVGIIGAFVDWAIFARIRDRPTADTLLLTFGLALLITGVLYQFGGRNIQVLEAPASLNHAVSLLGVAVPAYRLFVAALALALMAGLLIVLSKSAWGLRVRAANDDAEMAACLGVNRESLMHSVVGIGAALAAISGVSAAPIFNAYATVGDKILILAFMAVILGGLGSLRGAVVATYLVGLITVFGEAALGGQAALMALFVVVIIVLIGWPRGFFGEGRTE
jgi:branched-chain amino acid transport system permease protein